MLPIAIKYQICIRKLEVRDSKGVTSLPESFVGAINPCYVATGSKEKYPDAYIKEPINQLNATYDHYYRCKEYYCNRLN